MSLSSKDHLPGMTVVAPCAGDTERPFLPLQSIPPLYNRPVILIATPTIEKGNIYTNGLFQNIYLIYRICEALGWLPIFIVGEKPTSIDQIPQILHNCRIASFKDIAEQPIPVKIYIEVGLGVEKQFHTFMKAIGARVCKLYLGNILNIDTEFGHFYFPTQLNHHSTGMYDEIWTSPHYLMHAQYGAVLNHIEPGSSAQRIAPYIWDPCILLDDGRRHYSWRPTQSDEKDVIVIMEPNISFQKCSLIPLMIAEAFFRAHPDWNGKVIVVNGEKLLQSVFFLPSIYQHLHLVKSERLELRGRCDMISILKEYPNATFICHNVNNDYNYMMPELLTVGVPLIHNSTPWNEYAYFYKDNNIAGGVKQLEEVFAYHAQRLETYKSHARSLAWRHSMYNPEIQKAWKDLLETRG